MEPRELSITDATAALERRDFSAVELVGSVLERIEWLDEDVNAFIFRRPSDELLEEARRQDELEPRGAEQAILRGIPVALKANYQCAGVPTSAGSRILRDWVPEEDSEAVASIRAAGGIVLGMTNMHEFANGPTGYNPHYGNPLNPWDISRVPGGSSSGSAVALALDMCMGATGSDTGGSIRVPSAFCGVVGIKPTFGLLSTKGIVPFSQSLDHAGPMARTVGDIELLLRAMGGEITEPATAKLKGTDARPLDGLTVGVERDYFTSILDASVRDSFEDAVAKLEELGAAIRELAMTEVQASLETEVTILFPEAAVVHEGWLEKWTDQYGEDVRTSLLSGRQYSAIDYVRAQQRRAAIRGELDLAFEVTDILVTPTTIIEAPPWEREIFRVREQEFDMLNAFIRCTAPFNLSGHPAISVPCELARGRTPVGLQLVAPWFSERLLLDVAREFEAHRAGGRLVPRFPTHTPDAPTPPVR